MNSGDIRALISLLDDDDVEVLQIAKDKLIDLGELSTPFLQAKLEEIDLSKLHASRIKEVLSASKFQVVLEGLKKWKKEGAKDLLEGLWLVALYQYPELKLEKLRMHIKQFKLEAWIEFRENMHPYDQIKSLNHVFFNILGFSANTKEFHATNNSMINQIIEQRSSNPIGLCCLYMLIAQELSLPIYGVNLPNVFVLTYKQPNIQFYINVFSKGIILSRNELENHVRQLKMEQQDIFFEPCGNLTIVQRILRNLIVSFQKAQNIESSSQTEMILKAIITNHPKKDENLEND